MLQKKILQSGLILQFCAIAFVGCSSLDRADIPTTTDPRAEIEQQEADQEEARSKNIDVLAADDYSQSKKYLDKAKGDLEEGSSQEDVLDSLRVSKASLKAAFATAGNSEKQAEGLFQARQMALRAGAYSFTEMRSDLSALDEKVSDLADELQSTDAQILSDLQNQYIDLERRAVILSQLGKVQAYVNGAEKAGAADKAARTFKTAQLSLKTAESIISSSVRNPEGYRSAVNKAQADAMQLMRVIKTIEQNGNDLEESVAIKMVAQNKTISGLEQNLGDLATQGELDQAALSFKNQSLSARNKTKSAALNRANTKVRAQEAIEMARSEFSNAEAEAYQQDNTLVIRLKQIAFASGKADLPSESLPLLAKVLEVAKSLNSGAIRVEGHTDSVGSEAVNNSISKSRADAVASYLKANGLSAANIKAEGFGFSKPIASNKSKEGRATNRRVDVVIALDSTIE